MNRQDAHDATIQDMMTTFEIFGTGEGDPEEFRRLVSAIIDRYELYRTAGQTATASDFDYDFGEFDFGRGGEDE